MWKSYFWMAHYGGESPKRQVCWSNEKHLVGGLVQVPVELSSLWFLGGIVLMSLESLRMKGS